MSFFSRLFSADTPQDLPNIEFGRYTDGYKSEEKYDDWDLAVDYFEEGKYFLSFKYFLEYLSDEHKSNLSYSVEEDKISFSIYQGSKKLTGFANEETFRAECLIARAEELNIGVMRRMIERNYDLKFGRYCLDDKTNISILFDSITADASPYKLYYGLKEIALAADKQDDLLVEEFSSLYPTNTSHIINLDEDEKEIKLRFFRNKIETVLNHIKRGNLNPVQYPGGITYMLLDTVYRLDFLVRPEGYTMEAFERMHRSFFAEDGMNSQQKNHQLIKELRSLQKRDDKKIKEEFYRTISTFGVLSTTNHQKFRDIITNELPNMLWYKENEYDEVALSIPGYIAGHALFNYSLPEPDTDFLLLYYQITESGFFEDLGFATGFVKDGKLNKEEIREAVSRIAVSWKPKYEKLAPNFARLDFSDITTFAGSYLQMLADLDLNIS